jgi:hypothetical protein
MENIIIYGAGAQGRAARRILESQGLAPAAFADRDGVKIARGEWEGVKVIGLDALQKMDKSTPIIIGIGAGRLDILREVDGTLTGFGFVNVFWSAVEMMESRFPNKQIKDVYVAHKMEITTRVGCPIVCRACPQELFVGKYSVRSGEKMMSFETYKSCIDKVSPDVEIVFTGFGEPFTNPLCSDFVAYAFQKGHKVSLGTTLVGVTESTLEALSDFVFTDITLHLPDKERNTKFAITEDYLKILKIFTSKHWKNIPNCENYRRFSIHGELDDSVRRALLDAGVEEYPNIAETLHTRAGNVRPPFGATYPITVAKSQNIFCDYANYSNWHNLRKNPYINKDDLCYIDNFHFFVLLPNGDVTLCSSDFGLRHVFGNLLTMNYNALYDRNAHYDSYRQGLAAGGDCLCRNCFLAANYDDLRLVLREANLNG